MEAVKIDIKDYLGHLVKAKIKVQTMLGLSAAKEHEGRFVYSVNKEQLFFMPKGNRTRGYQIEEENVFNVRIIRRDKKEHYEQFWNYINRTYLQEEERERQRRESEYYRQAQEERRQNAQRKKEEEAAAVIENARSLGGYDELETEVIEFYRSFQEEYFNEGFVKSTIVPMLNTLIKKAVPDASSYPKHYFDKKRNPKLCALIEKKLGIKLAATQKANVERLNDYLKK